MSAIDGLFDPILDTLALDHDGPPRCPQRALNAVLARIRAVEGSYRQREVIECALGGVLFFEGLGASSTAARLLSGLQGIRDEIAGSSRRVAFVVPKVPPNGAVPVSSLTTQILAGRRVR